MPLLELSLLSELLSEFALLFAGFALVAAGEPSIKLLLLLLLLLFMIILLTLVPFPLLFVEFGSLLVELVDEDTETRLDFVESAGTMIVSGVARSNKRSVCLLGLQSWRALPRRCSGLEPADCLSVGGLLG